MSTIDLLTRVNGIIKKYEKYDADQKLKDERVIASHDHFLRLYRTIEGDLNDVLKVRRSMQWFRVPISHTLIDSY